jgi:hypothetical protein
MRTEGAVVGSVTMMILTDFLARGAAEIVMVHRNDGNFRRVVV